MIRGDPGKSEQLLPQNKNMAEPLLIRFQACGVTNRVPEEKLGQRRKPVCGACPQPLAGDHRPVSVTDATFQDEHYPLPVLLDVWTPRCGPCRTVAPILDQLAAGLAGRLRVAKLNADENPVTAARFGIQSIPAFFIFHAGREVDPHRWRTAESRNRASAAAGGDLIATPCRLLNFFGWTRQDLFRWSFRRITKRPRWRAWWTVCWPCRTCARS